jgi:hypothetical protein
MRDPPLAKSKISNCPSESVYQSWCTSKAGGFDFPMLYRVKLADLAVP